jgi:hypothetical protein
MRLSGAGTAFVEKRGKSKCANHRVDAGRRAESEQEVEAVDLAHSEKAETIFMREA